MVGDAVDASCDAVAVFDCGVVVFCPLRTDETERYGGFTAAAVAADGDGDGNRWLLGLLRALGGRRDGAGGFGRAG